MDSLLMACQVMCVVPPWLEVQSHLPSPMPSLKSISRRRSPTRHSTRLGRH